MSARAWLCRAWWRLRDVAALVWNVPAAVCGFCWASATGEQPEELLAEAVAARMAARDPLVYCCDLAIAMLMKVRREHRHRLDEAEWFELQAMILRLDRWRKCGTRGDLPAGRQARQQHGPLSEPAAAGTEREPADVQR